MPGPELCGQDRLPINPAGDYLEQFAGQLDSAAIRRERIKSSRKIRLPFWEPHRNLISSLPVLSDLNVGSRAGSVVVGSPEDLDSGEAEAVREGIELLIPWRKGPWELFGQRIESEWRSDLKWDRVAPLLGTLKGRIVADIGCGNGYYMYRLAELGPKLVLGMDPSDRFYYQFQFVQHFARSSGVHLEPFGVQHAPLYPDFFDLVLCMGVIYHRPDPIGMLKNLYRCTRPHGTLILESQAIAGEGDFALFPKERYAKARNVFFVPTANCLLNFVERAGFCDAQVCSIEKVTFDEQRRTRHARFESLEDFLDPDDLDKTIEGYPAPYRVIVKATKPKK